MKQENFFNILCFTLLLSSVIIYLSNIVVALRVDFLPQKLGCLNIVLTHGVQRRMISVDNFFVFFR